MPPLLPRFRIALLPLLPLLASVARAQSDASTPGLAGTQIPSNDEVVTLPEFNVAGSGSGYYEQSSTTGTRLASKVIDLPYSINIVTSEFINDFNQFDLDQLASFSGSVTPGDPAGVGGGSTKIHGFTVPYFRNGFLTTQSPDSNGVDRVEILNATASAIYGATAPGGIINFVTTKPTNTPQADAATYFGSYNYRRDSGFVSGPLYQDKLFYRIDAVYYDFERPTDFWFNRTVDVHSVLEYKPTRDTSVTVEWEHTNKRANDRYLNNGVRYIDPAGITQDYVYNYPDRAIGKTLAYFNAEGEDGFDVRENDAWYLTAEHAFNDQNNLRVSLGYSLRRFTLSSPTGAGNWSFKTNNWTGSRAMFYDNIKYHQGGMQSDYSSQFKLGSLQNHLLIGLDLLGSYQDTQVWTMTSTALKSVLGSQYAAWSDPNPFKVGYGDDLPLVPFDPAIYTHAATGITKIIYGDYGSFVSDTVTVIPDRLSLVGTVREDDEQVKKSVPLEPANSKLRRNYSDKFYATNSVGANLRLVGEDLILYGNLGKSFNPTPSIDQNTGDIYGNTTSNGGSIGFKGLAGIKTLSYDVSVYRIDQYNQAIANPANPTGSDITLPALIAGGGSRSEGADVNLVGQLTPNLSLIASLGWQSARLTKNLYQPQLIGQRLSTPARNQNFAGKYSFREGFLRGLTFGVTAQFNPRYINIYSTSATVTNLYLPSRSTWGALVSYRKTLGRRLQARVSLNLTNLFNQLAVTNAGFAPEGRAYQLSAGLHY